MDGRNSVICNFHDWTEQSFQRIQGWFQGNFKAAWFHRLKKALDGRISEKQGQLWPVTMKPGGYFHKIESFLRFKFYKIAWNRPEEETEQKNSLQQN